MSSRSVSICFYLTLHVANVNPKPNNIKVVEAAIQVVMKGRGFCESHSDSTTHEGEKENRGLL